MFGSFVRQTAALVLLALCALVAAPRAHAQATGSTDVSIDVQGGITILYYYSSVTVATDLSNLITLPAAGCTPAAGNTRACDIGTAAAPTVTYPTTTSVNAAFTIAPASLGTLNNITMTLANVWAVRALGGGANTTVAINNVSRTLSNGTSTVVLSNWQVSSGAAGPAASINFADPGLVTARAGNVVMSADFTGTTTTGAHTLAGTEYTLTVTNT